MYYFLVSYNHKYLSLKSRYLKNKNYNKFYINISQQVL